MASFGKLTEFDMKTSDWMGYVEQLDFFFIANGITDPLWKRAILLSSCGADCCNLFKGLVQPGKPGDLMQRHPNPKPNPIAERFKFNTRNRLPDEAISDYLAALRKLS